MDKTTLYKKLDIDTADEFKYYENLSALLEEDDYIENNLIKDLIKEVDKETFAEHLDSYFEDFLKNIPDDESDFYITVDSIKRVLVGMMNEEMSSDEITALADEILKFRKWYVLDQNVYDKLNACDINVRDARYNIMAAKFLDEKYDYDFRTACDYGFEGYDVRISDIIDEFDESEYEGFQEIDLTAEGELLD